MLLASDQTVGTVYSHTKGCGYVFVSGVVKMVKNETVVLVEKDE